VKDLESKQVLVTNAFEYGDVFDSNKKILRDVSPNDTSVLRKLLAGRADYAVAYDKVVAHLIQENPKEFAGKFNIVGTVDLPELYTVFSKKFPGSAGYVEHFNRGFETISKSNRLRDIERKWDSLSPPLPVKNPQ
jgi:polar amino acid transport system substrate-binding protein